jgi:hypothetical protein
MIDGEFYMATKINYHNMNRQALCSPYKGFNGRAIPCAPTKIINK